MTIFMSKSVFGQHFLNQRLNVKKYNLCDSAVLCALHNQLASLYRYRHVQLTRCFSAVAELLVNPVTVPLHHW